MPSRDPESGLKESLDSLRQNREAIPWAERRALAASLAEYLERNPKGEAALALLTLLSEDPKQEVRKEVADLLVLLPDVEFARLSARFSEDTSSFVQKAVERAMDRKRKGRQETERRRLGLDHVEAQYDSIKRLHGDLAAKKARALADEQFDTLVGATVHDIRGLLNPLKAGVSTMLENLKGGSIDPSVLRVNLTKMLERLSLLERFIDDMQAYSQATPAERRQERIADLVSQAVSNVQDDLKTRRYKTSAVTLDIVVPESLISEVARHQIVAAFSHILKNAYEAMESHPGKKKASIHAELQGEDVQIAISDTGSGMSPEDLETIRAFIPGKTTKKNQGTGFGLPTARRYAISHGGSLVIESEEGKGTTVTITLPQEYEGRDETKSAGR